MTDVVLRPRNGLSLCAGGGGLDMGLMLAEPDFHTRAFVEWEEYPRRCLIAAQRAGYFAPAAIWDDLTTFDGRPFRGAFDTILAGYPCQPFSHAGQRRGHDDERHLWPDVARIVREVEPEWVFLENVAGHVSLGAETVLRELWDMGYTPAAGLFSASETGAPHERLRWFCVAHRARERGGEPHDALRADTRGQSRFRAGGSGGRLHVGKPVADAKDCDRRIHPRPGPEGCGAPDAGRPVGDVGTPARIGCGEGRAEPGIRSGRDASASSGSAMADADGRDASAERQQCGGEQRLQPQSRPSGGGCAGNDLADASGSEREGQQRGQHHPRGRQVKDGHPALPRGAGLFPPGPGDASAWAAVIHEDAGAAPALGRGGTVQASQRYIASMGCSDAEASTQFGAGCMAGRRELSAVEREAAQVLGTPAVAAIRRLTDGMALRARALRLLGNGVFPLAAAHAWRSLGAAHGLWPVDMGAAECRAEAGANRDVRRMTK